MTLREAALAFNERQLSSVDLTKSAIDRIDNMNSSLHAFITLFPQTALDRAAQADRERKENVGRGPLHGIPVAVKDVFDMRGVPTTGGSKVINYVPTEDASVVQALEQAGAVVMGKLNMHELSYGITSSNPHFGAVRNPRDTERIPGGSSGGSAAAVAADLVFAALGTDTGGSVRIPAAYCGTVGLKPTFGRLSRFGVLPLAPSLDHVGVLARNVRDTASVFQAIVRYYPRDPASSRHPGELLLRRAGSGGGSGRSRRHRARRIAGRGRKACPAAGHRRHQRHRLYYFTVGGCGYPGTLCT